MHRRHLNDLLRRYARHWPAEAALAERFVAFAAAHGDCLWRTCQPGHLTASAWVLSPDDQQCLLLHHRKLGRWLQPGGHVDGQAALELAALREATEETGLRNFTLVPWAGSELVPLDLDVHPIPARGDEPAHDHWDVRFLLRAAPGQELQPSGESHAVRWFDAQGLRSVTNEASVLRLFDKARAVLGR